ncbi:hypothetical protein RRG08_045455 [Elysia crispata]|uniref:Uncharacterized protein n=1 Tax=Elysia crispata TaxID=231223 RepID=A0AAE1E6K5_9GAST|nr:hypothetical protein RRG08_045455 [Elysia crispata]
MPLNGPKLSMLTSCGFSKGFADDNAKITPGVIYAGRSACDAQSILLNEATQEKHLKPANLDFMAEVSSGKWEETK